MHVPQQYLEDPKLNEEVTNLQPGQQARREPQGQREPCEDW